MKEFRGHDTELQMPITTEFIRTEVERQSYTGSMGTGEI